MKDKMKDIRDDEIRVIGEETKTGFKGWKWLLLLLAGIVIGVVVWQLWPSKPAPPIDDPEPGVFEPSGEVVKPAVKQPFAKAEETGHAFVEMRDTVINDIEMRLYIPHKVSLSLHLGAIDRNDPGIIFTAQAADIRADNGGIVGAFVLKGEPKAWGLSKKGYCAIINDTVTVGVADNSPLFEEATEKGGYFFRQFPLVDNAIYLVGASAYGWATDADGVRHEFGDPNPKTSNKWRNINYLVMRQKS